MSEKISVKEYLENKELLNLTYIPYEGKVEICETIIDKCENTFNNYNTLNSVLLERVKTEIFISSITNLDFSIKDELGLDGYDQLCYHDELDELIYECGHLYEQFDEILNLMISDYFTNIASVRGFLNTLKVSFTNWISNFKRDTHEYIKNLDAKEIASNITNIIEESKNKK